MATNEIEILVKAEVTKAINGLKSVNKAAKEQEQTFGGLFKFLKNGYNQFATILTGTVAVALAKVTQKGIEFLDLNDTFLQTFSGIGKAANKMRNELVDAYGLSTNEATKLLSTNGAILQSVGLSTEKSLEFAGAATKLGAAIGDFNARGITAAQATDALTKALAGQTRGLKELGIVISDDDIKREAQRLGLVGLNGELTNSAKAQSVLSLATKQSSLAIENFNSKGDSLAEKQARIKSGIDDLVTAFGIELSQTLVGAGGAITEFLTQANRLETFQTIARKTIDIVKALGATVTFGFIFQFEVIKRFVTGIRNEAQNIAAIGEALSKGEGLGAALKKFSKDTGSLLFTPLLAAKDATSTLLQQYEDLFTGTIKNIETNSKGQKETLIRENKETLDVMLEDNKKHNDAVLVDNQRVNDSGRALQDFHSSYIKQSELEILEEKKRAAVEAARFLLGEEENFQIIRQDIEETYRQERIKLEEEANRKIVQDQINVLQAFGNAFSATTDFITQLISNQADEEIKQGKITDKEKKRRLREAALIQRGIAFFNSVVNTASAVVAGIAALPVPPFPFAIAAGIAGAAQTALIAAQPLPEFATGGLVTGPFPAMVGHGTEAILPADLTELLMNAAKNGNTTNNDNKNIVLNAYGLQNPKDFINKAQRELGPDVFFNAT